MTIDCCCRLSIPVTCMLMPAFGILIEHNMPFSICTCNLMAHIRAETWFMQVRKHK